MRAVDTNVLVRLLVQDDSRPVAAATQWVQSGAWVSTLALAETLRVLSEVYHRAPAQIIAAVETLLNHQNLTLQDPEAVSAALAIFQGNPGFGFSDCLSLELARKAGHLPLGTFDRSFAKLNGAHRL